MLLNASEVLAATSYFDVSSNSFVLNQSKTIKKVFKEENSLINSFEDKPENGTISEFSLASNQFSQDIGNVDGNRFLADIEFGYYRLNKDEGSQKAIEFSAQYNDLQALSFSVKNAFYRYQYLGGTLTLGREVLKWSEADKYWGFGFLNNRENFDFFEPDQEGLVGSSFKKSFNFGAGKVTAHAFATFLYIPELNPGLKQDNAAGTITATSPWATPPASSTDLNGESIPINYYVDMPNIASIVLKTATGINLAYEKNGYKVSGFYIIKPENKITTAAEVTYVNEQEAVYVNIQPQVYYHNVFGVNASKKIKHGNVYLGTLSSVPRKYPDGDILVSDYTKMETQKLREDYFVTGVNRRFKGVNYSLNYVARISSYNKKVDFMAQNPRWSQAINLRAQGQLSKNLYSILDVKYDTLTTDRLVMISAKYKMTDSSFTTLGINMIGTDNGKESFWAQFNNNDSVYAKLSYKF